MTNCSQPNTTYFNSTNSTLFTGEALWSSTSYVSLFILTAALLTNCSVVFLFLRNPSLFSPFTIYIFNLFIANLLQLTVHYPLDIIRELYDSWWMGPQMCTFFLYCSWMIQAAMCNAHALIALNRLWAIILPHSYRQHHSERLAIKISASVWLYLQACLLPGILLNINSLKFPMQIYGCVINTTAQKTWSGIVQVFVYDFPTLIVFSVYPTVCIRLCLTSRQRKTRIGIAPASVKRITFRSEAVQGSTSRAAIKSRKKTGFLVLTLMTFCVVACYTPLQLAYTVEIFFERTIPGLYVPAAILYKLITVLDPVLFVLALSELRSAFRRNYVCC